MTDLLPCPFCGVTPKDVHECDYCEPPEYHVICLCRHSKSKTPAEAIAAWNTRALKRPEAPDGWKLVPVEPTPEMLEPMAREDCKRDGLDPDEPEPPHGHYPRWYGRCSAYDAMYRAMLAAAPTHPKEMKP